MPFVLIFIGIAVLLPIIFVILTYNSLVALRNHIRDAWSNIDTELKRRYDLIPNLVATIKGYAAHEKEIFERVTQLRSQCLASKGTPNQQAADENQLVDVLKKMLLVVENYPQLKANQNFLELQSQLEGTENRIAVARMRYNRAARQFNAFRRTVFGSFFAGLRGVNQSRPYFEAEAGARELPRVEF